MKDSGKTTRCMARVKLNGLMVASIRGNISMTRSMELALSIGLMAESITDPGKMASSMAEVSTS